MADPRFKEITVEDVEETYLKGYITAAQRNKILLKKAQATLEEQVSDAGLAGLPKLFLERTIKHAQEGWDDIVEVATREPGGVWEHTKATGKAFWAQVKILTAPFTALGEISGQEAERLSLHLGASPGLARVINIAVDVGSGLVPVGGAARGLAKGVQSVGQIGKAKQAKQAAKAGEKVAEAVAKEADEIAQAAIKEGLKVDGVKIAEEAVKGATKTGQEGIKVLHSGSSFFAKERMTEAGFSVTTDRQTAKTFKRVHGGKIEEFTIPPEAKILKTEEIPTNLFKKREFVGEKFITPSDETGQAIVKYAREKGYDAVDFSIFGEGEIRILNPDILRSTKQTIKSLSSQEEFAKSLKSFRREMAELTERKAHEVTLKEADKLGLSLDDLKTVIPGQALNEAEMAAYLKALDGPVDDLVARSRAFLEGQIPEEELIKPLVDFFSYSPKFRGAEVTAGRSVEILKETPPMKAITDMLMGWDPAAMAKGDFKAAMTTVAEDIAALADEPGKLKTLQVTGQGMISRVGKEWWPMAREAYINLLLARPLTQVRNFLGNSFAAANSIVERQFAGWLSIDAKKGAVANEGYYQAKGMMAALADGIKAFGKAFKEVGPEEATKFDYIPHTIPGAVGRIINLPGDALRGMDNFFKTILQRGDYYAVAMREGSHKGLKGEKLADYVTRRVNMPTQGMQKHAADFALEQTFQNDLGTLGGKVRNLAQTGPLALWFPFMKTPINLAKYAWNRTPGLQFLSKSLYQDILAGGERADLAISRLTLSNLMGMFVYGLAQEGLITGGGPVDPDLRRSWLLTHEPYSVKTAEGWMPFSNTEPNSTILALLADYAEVRNQLDDPTAEQGAMAMALAISRDLVDKTYWQTLSQLIDITSSVKAGESIGKRATQVLASPATAVLTGGPLVASVARAVDPIRRDARAFLDGIRARIPGYSKDVPPMRDALGDPVLPPQALGGSWVGISSPLVLKPDEDDPLKREAARLQIRVPYFPDSIGGKTRDDFDIRSPMPGDILPVELTPQERDRWQVIYKNFIRHPEFGLQKLVEAPEYKNATFAAQREMFISTLAAYRSNAKDALLVENKELAKKTLEAQAGRYLPLVPPGQREEVESQIQGGVDLLDSLLPEARDNLLKWGVLGEETPSAGEE